MLSRASINDTYRVDRIMQCREDHDSRGVCSKIPTSAQPCLRKIDRHSDPVIVRQKETAIDRQPPAPIDRRAPLTYRVQMPKIDVARINALRPKPKPSNNPPETIMIPSDDAADPMEVDRRSSGGVVRDLEVQIGNVLVLVDFHVDIKLNWNSSLLLGRAFLSRVGAVCNLQTNQLCLTLINPHVHYNPIPVKKPQTSSRSINDPVLIAASHCGAEYETEYSASIETHTSTSIDSAHKKSTDTPDEESVDSNPKNWENDYCNRTMAAHIRHTMHSEEYDEYYEEERAIEYKAVLDEEDRLLHHSSWKRNASSIDRTVSTSIDTHPHQIN
ncbi:hypothetical protein F2Q69_00023422 [Brassica cretica]|uniref:Uncharacterized protein n=1 Tax=Brassica cretica TaxID=69181 RepID=A0A8S9Q9Q6_BRACR|nr:hypothetical protein F2Q69_00023422 [Brassica cretica]